MTIETISFIKDEPDVTLTCYIANAPKNRDALLICPGGAYWFVSMDREGYPVAEAFVSKGFNCFILNYSVQEKSIGHRPLIEASIAMQYIKENAQRFNINPESVFCLGFSAGGHLAASLATMWHTVKEVPEGINRPTGVILCYPVLTGKQGHSCAGTFYNLLGTKTPTDEQLELYSLENRVDERTSPAFLMHTFDDPVVPVEGSFYYAEKLKEYGIPMQMHIYPKGPHGLSLGNHITNSNEDCRSWFLKVYSGWVDEAAEWTRNLKLQLAENN